MVHESSSSNRVASLIVNAALILFGLLIFFGVFTFPVVPFWFAWVLALVGIVITSMKVANMFTRLVGLTVALVGVYLILREADVVSTPILQYGLGLLLIAVGAVNIIRVAAGRSGPTHQTQIDE